MCGVKTHVNISLTTVGMAAYIIIIIIITFNQQNKDKVNETVDIKSHKNLAN